MMGNKFVDAHAEVIAFLEKSLKPGEYIVYVQSRATSTYKPTKTNKHSFERMTISYDLEVEHAFQSDRIVRYHVDVVNDHFKITGRTIHITPSC